MSDIENDSPHMRIVTFAGVWLLFGVGMAFGADNIPTSISTKSFVPQEKRVTAESLPQPYATDSVAKSAEVVETPPVWSLNAPQGFSISVYAKNLNGPRWLKLSREGDLLVTETSNQRILRLGDTNADGIISKEETHVFANAANGLDRPFGMAFGNDYFYVASESNIRRFDYKHGQTELKGRGDSLMTLPRGGHWTRDLALAPDNSALYISVGSASNVDVEDAPRASILKLDTNGGKAATYASGLRNPVSISFRPNTMTMFAAVQERDGLGDDLAPDYFTHIEQGGFYGWPYTYASKEKLDPRRMDGTASEKPDLAARTLTPDVLFEAHAAVMATAWPQGEMFPERYRNGAFVTMRGSWNRSAAAGYKIVFIPFEKDRPNGAYEDFITGFVLKPDVPQVWARPVGAVFLKDGSMVFSDEANGRIYRVTYHQTP